LPKICKIAPVKKEGEKTGGKLLLLLASNSTTYAIEKHGTDDGLTTDDCFPDTSVIESVLSEVPVDDDSNNQSSEVNSNDDEVQFICHAKPGKLLAIITINYISYQLNNSGFSYQ
jgi:hypothetical protein